MNCPICKLDVNDANFEKAYISPYDKKEYKLYHCPNCHLEFWTPLKTVFEFYENEIFEEYADFHKGVRKMPDWQKPFFKHFSPKKGKLLDIGCGDGIFINEAQKIGFEVYGLDFDKRSVDSARNKYRLKHVYNVNINDFIEYADRNNLKFDVITFFEVLEHQDDPTGFIEGVKKLLNKGGHIAGSVPNREKFLIEIDRKNNVGDLPPHHFLWFSKSVLNRFFIKKCFDDNEFYPVMRTFGEFIGWPGRKLMKLSILKKMTMTSHPLKFIVNVLFSPVAIFLYLAIRISGGERIYFQAKLSG